MPSVLNSEASDRAPRTRTGKQRLAEITPRGMSAQIDISLTDDYPHAQAIVIISAVPAGADGADTTGEPSSGRDPAANRQL